jgi:hypothetical protein
MIGQIVECAICSSTFQVPEPIEGKEGEIHATFPYIFPEEEQEIPEEDEFEPEEEEFEEEAEFEEESEFEEEIEAPSPPDALGTSYEMNSTPAVTNTVKLSRSSIGMMPNIEDSFGFGTVEQKVPKYSTEEFAASEAEGIPLEEPVKNIDLDLKAPAPAKKWWKFWTWFSK